MKIQAPTLQEAFLKAADALGCSVTELDYNIIQHPSNGFFGLFLKRDAIITANKKGESLKKDKSTKAQRYNKDDFKEPKRAKIQKQDGKNLKVPTQKDIDEIREKVTRLINYSCFCIDKIEVSKYDDKTVLLNFDGSDAALLIGKDGHRYKAFSYMIGKFIYQKYGFYSKVEVSNFMEMQEEKVSKYLLTIKDKIEQNATFNTKNFDSLLIEIAKKQLDKMFPNKKNRIKNGKNGKFISITEK